MDKYQQFADLMKDERKAKEVISDSIEETQKKLRKYGLDFTIEELEEIAKKSLEFGEGVELNECALDDVSGGVAFATLCGYAFYCFAVAGAADVAQKWLQRRR